MSASNIGRVWLIAGPTASGKSALALRLAEAVGGEIVNADALQIYRDLRVLTARPEAREQDGVSHHLYGAADAAEAWSVGRWLQAARTCLADIAERGASPIVVGGTGLYFRALTQGLADIPPIPSSIRDATRKEFDDLGEAAFRERLRHRDPRSAQTIGANDRQRLTRAWDVVATTGQSITDWQAGAAPGLATQCLQAVVLEPPRAQLYARCDARLIDMIEHGALDEVAALTARDLDPDLPVQKALGLRPLVRHLSGELALAEALSLAQQDTRRYVKRQTTWFRHQAPAWPRIVELDAGAQWRALSALADGLT